MKLGKWDISVKVGRSPEMEKIERATLIQRSNDSFMHWARLQNNNGNVSVSVATVLRGMDWPGTTRLSEQNCIAFMLRKQRVWWAPGATQEFYLWGVSFPWAPRLHLLSSKWPQRGTQECLTSENTLLVHPLESAKDCFFLQWILEWLSKKRDVGRYVGRQIR